MLYKYFIIIIIIVCVCVCVCAPLAKQVRCVLINSESLVIFINHSVVVQTEKPER